MQEYFNFSKFSEDFKKFGKSGISPNLSQIQEQTGYSRMQFHRLTNILSDPGSTHSDKLRSFFLQCSGAGLAHGMYLKETYMKDHYVGLSFDLPEDTSSIFYALSSGEITLGEVYSTVLTNDEKISELQIRAQEISYEVNSITEEGINKIRIENLRKYNELFNQIFPKLRETDFVFEAQMHSACGDDEKNEKIFLQYYLNIVIAPKNHGIGIAVINKESDKSVEIKSKYLHTLHDAYKDLQNRMHNYVPPLVENPSFNFFTNLGFKLPKIPPKQFNDIHINQCDLPDGTELKIKSKKEELSK